jgi:hypothetical protein
LLFVAIVIVAIAMVTATTFVGEQNKISDATGRAHAAAFRDLQTGRPLPPGQERHEMRGTPAEKPGEPRPLTNEDLRLRLCSAESVAIVRITGRRSFLTDDASYVYTVYNARLLRVIKPTETVAPTMDAITFARPGGLVNSSDGTRQVRSDTFPSLQTGQVYILALRINGDVLVAENSRLQFRIANGRAQTMGEREPESPSAPLNDIEQRLTILGGSSCPEAGGVR